ncbi:MAG: low specificity L-threonine aldolase [Bacteroidetes bacterium]|nr:low specificity L-threonine aldolase [Bacteroidota bacterium]
MKGLASDNYAGVLPEMIEAIQEANVQHAKSYGYDIFTEQANNEFKKEFGTEDVTFVFNGTGANVLGIGTVTQTFNSILCADTSHMYVDESTAPETFTGCRLVPLKTNNAGKIEVETIQNALIRRGDEHHPQVKVLSIAQPAEYGTVYSLEELKAIGNLLKQNNIIFHMDGSRIFNAVASLGCSLKEMTKEVGVDILSVGGTKIGLLFGEAVVFFDRNLSKDLKFRQKQSMQLPSKMRFIAAQFHKLLKDKVWQKHATHANAMAQKLYSGTKNISHIQITKPVQANAVFAIIPRAWNQALIDSTPFYVWNEKTNEVRWMCSFDTTERDIDDFIGLLKRLSSIMPNNNNDK